MKYISVFLLAFVGITCCACGINSGKNQSLMEEGTTYGAEVRPLPGPTDYTLEELTEQTADFRDYIVQDYQKMQALAAEDTSYQVGKEAAKKVEEQYGTRIAELAEIDFNGMTEQELLDYQTEFTTLTTAIREAKDALTLG